MGTRQPTIYVWPRHLPKNTYLDLLYNAVADLGYEVHSLKWRPGSIFKAAVNRSRNKWLHFHWVGSSQKSLIITIAYWVAIIVGMSILRVGGLRLVWTMHNITPHNSRWKRIDWVAYKILLGMTRSVIAHSEWTVNELKLRYGWHGNVVVVPHGSYEGVYSCTVSPTLMRQKYATLSDSKVFLFVGTLTPYKGIERLIDCFKLIEDEKSILWIVGSGSSEMQRSLNSLVDGYPRIIFDPRFIPDDELGSLITAADVVVLPYVQISTSGSLVLAHSYGKAVVAPRLGSIPEYTDSQASVLYNPQDPNGLLKAVEACTTLDTNLMGRRAYNISMKWRWELTAKALVEITTLT